jgi:hypothetical protein
MKRINITLFALMLLTILFSCTRTLLNYTQNGNWVGRAFFAGTSAMGNGACFVIGNNAYVGTGTNPLTPNSKLTAMYRYTPGTIPPNLPYGYDSAWGSWTNSAAFPGQPRSNAVGFTIGGLGYIGSGLANDGITPLADFYSYDPSSNTWTQIPSCPGPPRYDATAFGLDSVGYFLTGTDNYSFFPDVWKYSPASNSWSSLVAFPGSPRSGAVNFSYNHLGYILTGFTLNSKYAIGNSPYDFWSFHPENLPGAGPSADTTKVWKRLRDIYNTSGGTYDDGYTNILRRNAVAFTILGTTNGDKGYVALGSNNGADVSFTWEYDFASDLWTEKTPFEGTARTGAVGFSIVTQGAVPTGGGTTRGFIACGLNQGSTTAFSDCDEFFPFQVYNQYD